MKKSIICTSILALICLLAFSGLAAAMKIDGPHEMNRQEPPLYDQYPCVGVDDVSVYYIDPSSCYASENEGKMVLGALLYATGGGVAPGGGPAKLGQCTVKFTTYLQNGERVIETFHQRIDINAMRHGALLDVLEMSGSAAQASHACAHEDFRCIRIFLDHLKDAHVLCDCHAKNLL